MTDNKARINVMIEGPVAEWLEAFADTVGFDVSDAVQRAFMDFCLKPSPEIGVDVEVTRDDVFDGIKAAADPQLTGQLVIVDGHEPYIAKVVRTHWSEEGTWLLDTVEDWTDLPYETSYDEDEVQSYEAEDVDPLTPDEAERWLDEDTDTNEVEAEIFKAHGYGK